MKNVNDKLLAVLVAVFALLLFIAVRSPAANFEFKGVYKLSSVFTTYCENCFVSLPIDYLNSDVVLAISTDDTNKVFKALQTSSEAVGWRLSKTGGVLKAEPLENVGMAVYVSCLDHQPKNVQKYLLRASLVSDSILCRERDSLNLVNREKAIRDSIKIDSLLKIPPLDFKNYELKYYSFTQSFTDKIGVEWASILAFGNVHNKLEIFDDWRIVANQTNDTTFTERSLIFSVDSSLNLDWGSEEQTLKQTFVNNGVTTQDYEWRKYGMIIQIKRDGKRVRMNYTFRDKENSITVLQGTVIGQEGDTLRLNGTYTTKRQLVNGVPFLSSIPLLGQLFERVDNITDNRAFELFLLPKKL